MDRQLVSVLISNHNYERWIGSAIASALAQTHDPIEVIVCDDGSSDASLDTLRDLCANDDRITLLTQENRGQGAALSTAARHAAGEILCFLDADDSFLPTKVERVVGLFEANPGAGLAVHRVAAVDDIGRHIQDMPQFASMRGGDLRTEVIRRGGRWTAAPSSALSIRSKWVDSVCPIPDDLRTGADAFVFGLMPLLAPVAATDEVLTNYRIHGSNAYGTSSPGLSTARRALREIELVNHLVNERLEKLGEATRLELGAHLGWHQQRATVALLEGGPEARSASLEAAKRIRADDLWPASVRLALSGLFATAPFLPRGLRSRWLGAAFGLSSLKASLGRLMR